MSIVQSGSASSALGLRASAGGHHGRFFGARVRMRHMGSIMVPTVFEDPTGISGAAIADVEVTFTIDERIRVGLGANNLLDKLPAQLPDDHVAQLWSLNYAPESPYGIAGRVTYLKLDVFGT